MKNPSTTHRCGRQEEACREKGGQYVRVRRGTFLAAALLLLPCMMPQLYAQETPDPSYPQASLPARESSEGTSQHMKEPLLAKAEPEKDTVPTGAAIPSLGARGTDGEVSCRSDPGKGETPRVEWLGQSYLLGRHRSAPGAETDEFFLENEGPEDWSQLLAVQKTKGGTPQSLVNRLRGRVGLRLEVLQQDPSSCVLTVHENLAGQESREGVLLVRAGESAEDALVVISYLLKPSRVEAGKAGLQLEAWRERLLAQTHRQARERTGAGLAQP